MNEMSLRGLISNSQLVGWDDDTLVDGVPHRKLTAFKVVTSDPVDTKSSRSYARTSQSLARQSNARPQARELDSNVVIKENVMQFRLVGGVADRIILIGILVLLIGFLGSAVTKSQYVALFVPGGFALLCLGGLVSRSRLLNRH